MAIDAATESAYEEDAYMILGIIPGEGWQYAHNEDMGRQAQMIEPKFAVTGGDGIDHGHISRGEFPLKGLAFRLDEFAKKYGRLADNNFAAACYNENSLEELQFPHKSEKACPHDCKMWGITSEEWSDAISAALAEKLTDL